MFRLADPDHAWPGTIEVAVPGRDEPMRHPARWRLLDDDEIDRLLAQSSTALLKRALAGWDGIEEHDGTPLPHSERAVERLCRVPYWRRAAVDAYMRFVSGLPEKNSSTPPADGGEAAEERTRSSSPPTSIH